MQNEKKQGHTPMRSQSFLRNSKSSSSGLFACCLASSTSICKRNSGKKKKNQNCTLGKKFTSDHNEQKKWHQQSYHVISRPYQMRQYSTPMSSNGWLIFKIRKLHAEMVLNLDWKAYFCNLQYWHKWEDCEEDWWLLSKTSYCASARESGSLLS